MGGTGSLLWCHGGPGSRLEPAYLRREASEAGLRVIGIDRPGYGLSTPQPGRTIAGWVPEALAVADHLGIGPFAAVGISTGGAYALDQERGAPVWKNDKVVGVTQLAMWQEAAHGPRIVEEKPDTSLTNAPRVWLVTRYS